MAIVDEYPINRWGLERALEDASDLVLVASVATADRLTVDVDVLFLACDTPRLGLIRQMATTSKVLVVSASRRPADVEAVFRAGGRGYLHMTAEAEVITEAVRGAAAGNIVRPHFGEPAAGTRATSALSPRESQVLQLIGIGYTHDQAASRLGVSRHTIDTYVKRLRGKLGGGNKAHLAMAALLDGYLLVQGSQPPA